MDANLATVLVALIAAIASSLSAWFSHRNGQRVSKVDEKVDNVHQQLNSRLDALLAQTQSIAHAAGMKEGIIQGTAEEKARTTGDKRDYEP